MLMSEMQRKDIINSKDGQRLGKIIDLEVDRSGQIEYMVIGESKLIRKFNAGEYKVSFKDIRTIGSDVILVDLNN